MRLSTYLTTAICFLSDYASTANTLKFINHCGHNLYFWIVNPDRSSEGEWDASYIIVPPNGGSVVHHLIDTLGGGISLKIRDLPHYVIQPAGILQAEYELKPQTGQIWYDFSAIDCNTSLGPENPYYCPFIGGGVKMWVPKTNCPVPRCVPGSPCVHTYEEHGSWLGEPTWNCHWNSDILFEVCTHGPAERTWSSDEPAGPGAFSAPVQAQPSQPQSPPTPKSLAHPIFPHEPFPYIPPEYPTPPGYPENTRCYDQVCQCYTANPRMWPEHYPPGTPKCVNGWPFPDRETFECKVYNKCGKRVARGMLGSGRM